MRKSELCFVLVGVLFVAGAVVAQDAPGDPAEVAAEIAAAAAWQASPEYATDSPVAVTRKVEATVFFSNAGDCPEHILMATIQLTSDWRHWRASEPASVLMPEMAYEGADLPLLASQRGWSPERVRQLRDPGIFREAERTYLLYSVAGEHGIAIAELLE